MAKLDRILGQLVLGISLSFCGLFFMVGGQNGYCEEAPNPIKEITTWVVSNNVGATFLYDLDQEDYGGGAKVNLFKSEHDWLYFGLVGRIVDINDRQDIALGVGLTFNLGKLLSKMNSIPAFNLSHLEVGYYINHNFGLNEWQDGLLMNVIKIEF